LILIGIIIYIRHQHQPLSSSTVIVISTCRRHPSSSVVIIISDHHRHPPFGQQRGPSTSRFIVIRRSVNSVDHGRRSSTSRNVIVIDLEVHRHPLLTLKICIVSRLTDRWKIVFSTSSSFTSHEYPVGSEFEYFGNSLASL